jgi:hypothetical protein
MYIGLQVPIYIFEHISLSSELLVERRSRAPSTSNIPLHRRSPYTTPIPLSWHLTTISAGSTRLPEDGAFSAPKRVGDLWYINTWIFECIRWSFIHHMKMNGPSCKYPLHVSNKWLFIIRRLFLYTQHTVFYHASMECLRHSSLITPSKCTKFIRYVHLLFIRHVTVLHSPSSERT